MLFWRDLGLDINICFKNEVDFPNIICSWSYVLVRKETSGKVDFKDGHPTQDKMCVSLQLQVREDKRGRGHVAWDRQYRLYLVLETEIVSFIAWRFLSVKGLLIKHNTGPEKPAKYAGVCLYFQCWGGGGRQVLGAHKPSNLACFASSRSGRQPISKHKVGGSWRVTSKNDLWPLLRLELLHPGTHW